MVYFILESLKRTLFFSKGIETIIYFIIYFNLFMLLVDFYNRTTTEKGVKINYKKM